LDNPPAVLRRLASHVRPGGDCFHGVDVTRIGSVPEAPLFHAMANWITGAFKGVGVDPAMGSSLGRVFREAGLPWPNMNSFQKASCGPDGFYWLFAETVRTLLPNIIRLGLATAEEVGIDSLESRLCEEATSTGLTAFSPRWVSAWVRAPLQ